MLLRPLLVSLWFVSLLPAQAGRAVGGQQLFMEVGGNFIPLFSSSGGDAVAEVVETTTGTAGDVAHKRLGAVTYEPLQVEAELLHLLPYVANGLAGKAQTLDFCIVRAGNDAKVTSRLRVTQALMTQVEIGTLDASSKDLLRVALTFQPERAVWDLKANDAIKFNPSKGARPSNGAFRVTLAGLDASAVRRVEHLGMRVPVASGPNGTSRSAQARPGSTNVHNPILTMGEAGVPGFLSWHQDVVIEGRRDPKNYRDLSIEVLSPDMRTVMLRLQSRAILVAARRHDASGAPTELAVELLVESWAVGN